MRIEDDLKLTFDDVLIRPKRSRLKSRADVTLEREFTFPHSDTTWSGIPVVAANMDTTGTFAMAQGADGEERDCWRSHFADVGWLHACQGGRLGG